MNDHARASELLPWMVNGRIEPADGRWLNGHLEQCSSCRVELETQWRIRDAITREPTVEFAPQASFNRLWKRIEAGGPDTAPEVATVAPLPLGNQVAYPRFGRGLRPWVRATMAAQAAAILVLCGVLWLRPLAPAYRTVTDATPGPSATGTVIKVIFDDQVRLADVKEILAGADLVVASGPSGGGVYALAPRDLKSQATVSAAAARLRADPRVPFADGRRAVAPGAAVCVARSLSSHSGLCSWLPAPAAVAPRGFVPQRWRPQRKPTQKISLCSRSTTSLTGLPPVLAAPGAATAALPMASVTAPDARCAR